MVRGKEGQGTTRNNREPWFSILPAEEGREICRKPIGGCKMQCDSGAGFATTRA